MGHLNSCRAVTRSPVDFRSGRRASDGLVAQGLFNQVESSPNAIAFNSQRLHEGLSKAKGVLELHLLQQEAASLSSKYQTCVPIEEINVRQREHSQFFGTPIKTVNDQNSTFHCAYKYEDSNYFNKTSTSGNYVGIKNDDMSGLCEMRHKSESPVINTTQSSMQKPPLQQQLMQHRLLQQKRQILQKQGALETCLSRRMLRQQSYKIAQNQQVLPPLPLNEKESEDLLEFHQKIENASCTIASVSSSNLLKTTYLHNQISPSHYAPQIGDSGIWNNLTNNLQSACQITENLSANESCQSKQDNFNWNQPCVITSLSPTITIFEEME